MSGEMYESYCEGLETALRDLIELVELLQECAWVEELLQECADEIDEIRIQQEDLPTVIEIIEKAKRALAAK